MRSVELFTGAGGLALGSQLAGFHHVAVVERDRDACNTLWLNRQHGLIDWPIFQSDIAEFDYCKVTRPIDLLAGGPPCQPFSLGGKHEGQHDRRNLFPEAIRAVQVLRPRAFVFENVKGLLRTAFAPYYSYIVQRLRLPFLDPYPDEHWEAHRARLDGATGTPWSPEQRYDVRFHLYDATDFGVPQRRHRVFIVGFRHDLGSAWHFPEPTHSEDALLYAQYVDRSYWAEHGLPTPPVPPKLAQNVEALALAPKPSKLRWHTVRDALGDLPEPINFQPHPDFLHHVGIPDARVYPGHTGSPWDWPAKAIKAGDHGNPGGENMLRYDDDSVRYFTVRELARLQTFPDTWQFARSWSESRRQLGNAVPVLLAATIARHIHAELGRIIGRNNASTREMVSALVADD